MTGVPTTYRELLMQVLCNHLHRASARGKRDGEKFFTGSLSDKQWGEYADVVHEFVSAKARQDLASALNKFAPDLAAQISARWQEATDKENTELADFLKFLRTYDGQGLTGESK